MPDLDDDEGQEQDDDTPQAGDESSEESSESDKNIDFLKIATTIFKMMPNFLKNALLKLFKPSNTKTNHPSEKSEQQQTGTADAPAMGGQNYNTVINNADISHKTDMARNMREMSPEERQAASAGLKTVFSALGEPPDFSRLNALDPSGNAAREASNFSPEQRQAIRMFCTEAAHAIDTNNPNTLNQLSAVMDNSSSASGAISQLKSINANTGSPQLATDLASAHSLIAPGVEPPVSTPVPQPSIEPNAVSKQGEELGSLATTAQGVAKNPANTDKKIDTLAYNESTNSQPGLSEQTAPELQAASTNVPKPDPSPQPETSRPSGP